MITNLHIINAEPIKAEPAPVLYSLITLTYSLPILTERGMFSPIKTHECAEISGCFSEL